MNPRQPPNPAAGRRRITGPGLLLALALALALPAGAAQFELDADTWARPRTAVAVMKMGPVGEAVRAWMNDPAQMLEIRYPGGESGMLWAEELRDWLVSLGVPLEQIQTLSGSAVADRLQVQLRNPESRP